MTFFKILKRVSKILELEEVKTLHYSNMSEPILSLTKCSFTWKKSYIRDLLENKNIKDYLLCDVSFEIKKGEILGVIGSKRSGKTTLLYAIMKENILVNGKS